MSREIPFIYDQVGSYLRPARLKEARESFAKKQITKAELTTIEDEEITKLIIKQKEAGLKAVTDGEFRRRWWHLDFIAGFKGIEVFDYMANAFGIQSEVQGTFVCERLAFKEDHPFLEHFAFTKRIADVQGVIAKQTIAGPNMIYLDSLLLSKRYAENPIYSNVEDFKDDVVKTYQDAILAFYDKGCRYLQIDDTSWGALFDDKFIARIKENGHEVENLLHDFKEITERILEVKPNDLAITFHFCRGNFQSRFLYSGPYDAIAEQLLSIEKIDGFFLEFDDERSGGFEPLQYLKDQKIVLGLITTKNGTLEDKEVIKRRIEEATRYVHKSQICLSPQCGFASTHEGNSISEEDQWKKIKLVVEIAKECLEEN